MATKALAHCAAFIILLSMLLTANAAAETNVTTLAGSGDEGYVDGAPATAQFGVPSLVAVLSNGSFVVTDSSNNCVRLVSPTGTVSTLAGNNTIGNTDGTGSAARFSYPCGVAILLNGSIVVVDADNANVRLVSLSGVVTTLAGGSAAGYADGPGATAMFQSPVGAVVLSNGSVVIVDQGNNRIRLVSVAGAVTTLAGSTQGFANGPSTSAKFKKPMVAAILPNGSIAISDWGNYQIRLVTADGTVTTLAGTGTMGTKDGAVSVATFRDPFGLAALPNGNLLVADRAAHRIRLVTPDGTVTTVAGGVGGYRDGPLSVAQFYSPNGITVLSTNIAIVTERDNKRIRLVPVLCVNSTNCNSHASSVSGTLDVGCSCTCATGYTGANCNSCASGYSDYPTCSLLCTNSSDCSGRATAVSGTLASGCSCTCAIGYTGAACNSCASGYSGYPTCSLLCTNSSDCSGRATAVSGTLASGCSCTCATGYTGATCNSCASGYSGYPTCSLLCTNSSDCSGHADAVVGTLVSGCVCTCSVGYIGTSCSACSSQYQGYPTCSPVPCRVDANCSSHATSVSGTSVSGCACTCAAGYGGAQCNACATGYSNYPSCVATSTVAPTSVAPTTVVPSTPPPTQSPCRKFGCRLAFRRSVEEISRVPASLIVAFAKLFRCTAADVSISRIFAGSTIVEFNVTTNLTQVEATAAVTAELANSTSELATTFAAISGTFEMAAPFNATVALTGQNDKGVSAAVVAPIVVAAVVVCVGCLVVGLFLLSRSGKKHDADTTADHKKEPSMEQPKNCGHEGMVCGAVVDPDAPTVISVQPCDAHQCV